MIKLAEIFTYENIEYQLLQCICVLLVIFILLVY